MNIINIIKVLREVKHLIYFLKKKQVIKEYLQKDKQRIIEIDEKDALNYTNENQSSNNLINNSNKLIKKERKKVEQKNILKREEKLHSKNKEKDR
jgi:galactokinase/mevalonate kinase-like predicted kinase